MLKKTMFVAFALAFILAGLAMASSHEGNGVVTDDSGAVYVSGFGSNSDFEWYFFVLKYSAAGELLWSRRQVNGEVAGLDAARCLALGGDGNPVMVGTEVDSDGEESCVAIKYSPTGDKMWSRQDTGSFGENYWMDVVADADGRVAITGKIEDKIDTVVYDAAGNKIWNAATGGGAPEGGGGMSAAFGAAGDLFVLGRVYEWAGDPDYFVLHYLADGTEDWGVRYAGTVSGFDWPSRIRVDSFGDVLVGGYADNAEFVQGTWVIKLDAAGNEVWTATYAAEDDDDVYFRDMVVDDQAGLYVATDVNAFAATDYQVLLKYDVDGNLVWERKMMEAITRDAELDPGVAVVTTGTTFKDDDDGDYHVVKYDLAGTLLWQASYAGPGDDHDYARNVTVDDTGNVIVTGGSCLEEFVTGPGCDMQATTIKYDADGNELWVARFGEDDWDWASDDDDDGGEDDDTNADDDDDGGDDDDDDDDGGCCGC